MLTPMAHWRLHRDWRAVVAYVIGGVAALITLAYLLGWVWDLVSR